LSTATVCPEFSKASAIEVVSSFVLTKIITPSLLSSNILFKASN